MENIISIILGVLLGGLIGWFVSSSRQQKISTGLIAGAEGRAKAAEALAEEKSRQLFQEESELNQSRNELLLEKQAKTEALTRLEESIKNFEEQKALLSVMKTEMTDTFNALSRAALDSSNESFLTLASERLGRVVEETKGRLGEHQAAMDGMIKPLAETLKRYEEQIQEMEKGRHRAYGSLEEQLRALALTHESLQKETSNLVTALRRPEVRGRWGEMQLRRVAELGGMSEHCDFEEQVSVDTEKGRLRPDMTVKLPGDRRIVVDSKVSLSAYLEAIAGTTDEDRKARIVKHGQQVRQHMMKLSSKEYWSQFDQSPEFVVLFIPGEVFLSAALESDATLIEDGIQRKVIIATPSTFIALLRAIAYGWRQEQMTKNAQLISVIGKELYERMSTLAKHFNELGANIGKTMDAYNRLVASMEVRVFPSVRRFRELGVAAPEEIPVIEQKVQKPRNLSLLDE